MNTDTLTSAAEHISFAEQNNLSNVDVFLKGIVGVVVFMLLLIVCMKLSSWIARKIDSGHPPMKNKGKNHTDDSPQNC